MLELYILIISILIIIAALYYRNTINEKGQLANSVETFENYYLSSCPAGFKSFYNSDGNIICCDGDVIANKCLGENQCTLSGKGTSDMPKCVDYILDLYQNKSKDQCPNSLPSYFENKATKVKGCTSGSLNDTLNGPKFSSQQKCTIYSTFDENRLSKDSCYNQKQLDLVPCFGNNCTKELVQPISTAPPLAAIGFTDNSGMHRIAYTQQSMENFLDVSNPNWKNQGMDLSKNINIAEVAKAYYVDRTMDQTQIQF